MTILQARLLSEVIADEQIYQARIHGCEVEEQEDLREATSSDIQALMAFAGG